MPLLQVIRATACDNLTAMEKKHQPPELPKPQPASFRFLTEIEFEALSQPEKQKYVVRAYKKIKQIRKMDD